MKIRIDCVAEFLVDAVIETSLTPKEFDLLDSQQKRNLIWDSLNEGWNNTGRDFRDAEVRPFQCCALDEYGNEVLETTVQLDGKSID